MSTSRKNKPRPGGVNADGLVPSMGSQPIGAGVLHPSVVWLPVGALKKNPRNSRRHPRKQIYRLAEAMKDYGFTAPILIDESRTILAGHGRLEAAVEKLGMTEVPTLLLTGLSPAQKRAFVIADNRLAELAGWDNETLRIEFQDLIDLGIDVELTAFDTGEIDILLDGAGNNETATADLLPEPPEPADTVARVGDLWLMGRHRLLCADSLVSDSYLVLLEGRKANLVFADPPYNVKIKNHVSGLGKIVHREFAMASGEMSVERFTRFLAIIFGHLVEHSVRGSIHFICMDWRHLYEVLSAGRETYSDLKNLIVWNKTNAGMGSLYRSQHELVLVYQNGSGPFTNNVNLGATRYRTNVWTYPGMSSMRKGREEELAMHPTVKPTALVADAIRDCSKRNELVLDPFSGSGTTIMAAHRTGRIAAAMEIDPAYVDVAIERWQKVTGETAVLSGTGETFAAVRAVRKTSAAE